MPYAGFSQFWSNHVNLLLGAVARYFANGAGKFNSLWFLEVQVYAVMAESTGVCLEMSVGIPRYFVKYWIFIYAVRLLLLKLMILLKLMSIMRHDRIQLLGFTAHIPMFKTPCMWDNSHDVNKMHHAFKYQQWQVCWVKLFLMALKEIPWAMELSTTITVLPSVI